MKKGSLLYVCLVLYKNNMHNVYPQYTMSACLQKSAQKPFRPAQEQNAASSNRVTSILAQNTCVFYSLLIYTHIWKCSRTSSTDY